jgi:diacylglycerol O-acyltransferase / wax synthase
VFEGEVAIDEFRRFIESKLSLVPRYRQRVQIPPLNLGLPVWSYDPEFDLRNHTRQVQLRRGTTAEFKAAAARLLSQTMDHCRPLWDLTLVNGLQGNRTGLIVRVHHCLADGLAGIGLLNSLLDASPVPPRISKHSHPVTPPKSAPLSLLDTLVRSSFSAVQQVLSAHSDLLTFAERLVAAAGTQAKHVNEGTPAGVAQSASSLTDELGRLLPEVAAPAHRLPFNVICRGPQKFHWAEIPVAEIKAVKQACGATFNDVALAAVVSAVRRYSELHDVRVSGRLLRIVVPVSLRGKYDATELGNRITFLPVTLPLDIKSPRRLIDAVRRQMTLLKAARLAEVVGFAGTLIGTIPTALQALLGPLVSQLPLSLCNLIFTNVRGPDAPLYLLGHKMVACYPYVPIGGEMGMNCAMLTYNGTAFFGFTGDTHAIPDLEQFEKLLRASFAELKKRLVVANAGAAHARVANARMAHAPSRAHSKKSRKSLVKKVADEPAPVSTAVAPTASTEPGRPAPPPPQTRAAVA